MSAGVYTLSDLGNWPELEPPGRLSVFGDPVAHSLSPEMHNPGLVAAGIDAQYVRLHVKADELKSALQGLRENGFIGTNVTVPHKATIAGLMDETTETASKIGAVNTVRIDKGGRLIGHSTDGGGFQKAVEEAFGRPLKEQRVLLLGAGGGAGRAVAMQCASIGCERLVLSNRTMSKAVEFGWELESYYPDSRIEEVEMSEVALAPILDETDLIINGTSIGMKEDDPSLIHRELMNENHCVYDMIYSPPKTRLLADAESVGAKIANGLSMLLWQGVLSFEFWFDQAAPVEQMREGLMQAVS